jgi:hypothetical protein
MSESSIGTHSVPLSDKRLAVGVARASSAIFVLLVGAAVVGRGEHVAIFVAFGVVGVAALVKWQRIALSWEGLIVLILAVVLIFPMGRVSFSISLPVGIEPYRIAVALVLTAWFLSLLVDSRVRLRRSPFDVSVAVIAVATVASLAVNYRRVFTLETAVLKQITFFFSYILLFYLVVSVIRSGTAIALLTKMIVAGTAVVGVGAAFESRTRYNVFEHISALFPFLIVTPYQVDNERGGLLRAIASAEHPIALGVLFVMVVPLAFALANAYSRAWFIAVAALLVGVVSTVSRTPIVSLFVVGAMLVWLRPRETLRFVPLTIPLVLVLWFAMPGSVTTIKDAFFPKGGLIAQQSDLAAESDPELAGGRIRLLKPMLEEGSRRPIFGQGAGTRQTGLDNPLRNSPVLDDQWLGLFLEVGLLGVVGWLLLIGTCVKRLVGVSRVGTEAEGWLAVGYAASIVGFSVGMLTYDSMSFPQAVFIFWIVLALSAALVLRVRETTPKAKLLPSPLA